MSRDPRPLPQPAEAEPSLAALLRERALACSPRLLAGQAVAGVVLNGMLAAVQPDRWGIALLGALTVSLHGLWGLAVQRTGTDACNADDEGEDVGGAAATRSLGWWRVRRVAAVTGSLSALALLWSGTVVLLGRWIS